MLEIKFIPAAEEDIERIYLRTRDVMAWYERGGCSGLEPRLMEVYRRIQSNLRDYRVIKFQGHKVGHFCFRLADGAMVIEDLFIEPDFRCNGAATQIVRKCISETELPIRIETYILNIGAVSLFRNNGFSITEHLDDRRCIMVCKNDKPFDPHEYRTYSGILDYIEASYTPPKRGRGRPKKNF